MPGKCGVCDNFRWTLNKCTLCTTRYCDDCKFTKYLAVAFNLHRPSFPVCAASSMYNSFYEKILSYYMSLCHSCHYNYNANLCKNCVSDSILVKIFIDKVIQNYDITIIYDDSSCSNNSIFFFLSDMHTVINHMSKIGKPYPYEIFYYTALPDTQGAGKKSSNAYKKAFKKVPDIVENIIISYDNPCPSNQILSALADKLIKSNDETGKTQAMAGFLSMCVKHNISISPFDNYKTADTLPVRRHVSDIEESHRAICGNILNEYACITCDRRKVKKAVVVMPNCNYPSNCPSLTKPLDQQMQYVLAQPPFCKNRAQYRVATVEKCYKSGNTVRLQQKNNHFSLTY